MNPTELLAGIQDVAREHLDHHAPLSLEQPLVEALRLDSIRMLTLVAEVEVVVAGDGTLVGTPTVTP